MRRSRARGLTLVPVRPADGALIRVQQTPPTHSRGLGTGRAICGVTRHTMPSKCPPKLLKTNDGHPKEVTHFLRVRIGSIGGEKLNVY
jgi:hypothetical protein